MATPADFSGAKLFPVLQWVRFDHATALLFDGFQGGFQSERGDSATSIPPINDEAGYTPQFATVHFERKFPVIPVAVEARELVGEAVLTPADWFTVCVDEDAVGAAFVDESFLFGAIPLRALGPGAQPLIFREAARTLEMDAEAVVPAIAAREEIFEVGPGGWGEFFGVVIGGCGRHKSEPFGIAILERARSATDKHR